MALAAACYPPLLLPLLDEAVSPLFACGIACGGFAHPSLLAKQDSRSQMTQMPTRLLCLLLWLGRVDYASAAQKAVRLEVGFDSGLRDKDFLGRPIYGAEPSYFVTIALGTPPQPINATLQLRSVDFTAVNATALVCRDARGANNCTGLAYDKMASTSVIALASQGIYGSYVGDAVSFGGDASLTDQAFDIILPVNAFQACTLGLEPGTQYYSLVSGVRYPSVLSSLAAQGKINSPAFSLWLNRNIASTGLLVFGGVDTAAYHEPLVTIPVITDAPIPFAAGVAMAWTDLTITAPNGTLLTGLVADNFSMAAVVYDYAETLVSGCVSVEAALVLISRAQAFPPDIVKSIVGAFGASSPKLSWDIPCNNSGSLTMQFAGADGPMVTMPFTDLVTGSYDGNGNPKVLNGVRMCALKLTESSERDRAFLGSIFLNSAYMVVDYDQNQVSLAQGNRDISGSNVLEIASGPRGVPGVASTVTGPVPSYFTLMPAATSASASPAHRVNSAATKYPSTAMLYKVVAIMLVVAV